jgi:hypothetical protein
VDLPAPGGPERRIMAAGGEGRWERWPPARWEDLAVVAAGLEGETGSFVWFVPGVDMLILVGIDAEDEGSIACPPR